MSRCRISGVRGTSQLSVGGQHDRTGCADHRVASTSGRRDCSRKASLTRDLRGGQWRPGVKPYLWISDDHRVRGEPIVSTRILDDKDLLLQNPVSAKGDVREVPLIVVPTLDLNHWRSRPTKLIIAIFVPQI
jgi:hypothetical protein